MIRNIIINTQKGEKYPADDVPLKVLSWLDKNKRHTEEERSDVIEGQTVVVLKGQLTSFRAVVVKKLPKNLLLVVGPSASGEKRMTVLNQRFVHPVSVFIPLERSFIESIGVKEGEISEIKDWTLENACDLEIFDLLSVDGVQEKVNSAVEKECAGTKGLKTYFSTPFTLPREIDPMSAFY